MSGEPLPLSRHGRQGRRAAAPVPHRRRGAAGAVVVPADPQDHEQAADLGESLRVRVRRPPVLLLELPQVHPGLVQVAGSPAPVVRVARALRVGAPRRRLRGALDGRRPRRRRPGDAGDVDIGRGAAGLLREAQEGSGPGREEDNEGDRWAGVQGSAQGREYCRCGLCCSWVLRSCQEER